MVAALTDLLKGKAKCIRSTSCQQALDVKHVLSSPPVLAAPCKDRPLKLHVDGSNVGAGAVLFQPDNCGIDRP